MPSYPNLPEGLELRLKAIDLTVRDSDISVGEYLDHPDCPYPRELRSWLRRMLSVSAADVGGELIARVPVFDGLDEVDKFDAVLNEIQGTIEQMKALEGEMKGNAENANAAERLQLIKAKTSLLEKWANLKERIYTVRETAEFQSIVFQIMDQFLDVDGRKHFLDELRRVRSVSDLVKSKSPSAAEG